MAKEECIFCKIVAGEIPSTKVYEDESILAFEDVNPQMPVHVLLIPKEHYVNFNEEIPDELLGHLFNQAKRVARIKGIDESGYRVIINNGPDAKQVVGHLHAHVMGGAPMVGGSPREIPGVVHKEQESQA